MKIIKNVFAVSVIIVSVILILSSCKKEVPAQQIWTISWMPDCGLGTCGTSITILKGGAISQRDPATRVFVGGCSYTAPVTGQWSGKIFKITMNGGGCGQQVQGFSQGNADGEYGTARTASGTITWTFNNQPSIVQTWTARLNWSVVGSNISSGGSGKVEILFTSNGTVTLWSKTYAASTTPYTQQLNERVTLPSLPDKGKLIIRIKYNLGTPASVMTFEIDNIRVE